MAGKKTPSKDESDLLKQMFDAWNGDGAAFLFELATTYTQRYPDNYWGWVILADALSDLARYDEAERALRQAQRLVPAERRINVYAHWGHLYDRKCDLNRAARWYRRALKEKGGKNTMRCLIYLGGVLAKQGRFAEAEECHRKAISLSTDPADEAYYNLGLVLRAQQKYKQALRCFSRAVKIDPAYAIAEAAWKDTINAEKFKKQNRREKSKS
jgi:protein O-GlcNAc transferase